MQTFGDYLKEQREDKNISLKEVALLTNVTERYLDFIEKDDFEKVPEGPYIRGYISLYAKAIGINPQEVVHRFDSQCRKRNKTEELQQEISEQKITEKFIAASNNRKWFLFCSAILCLLILVAYHLLFENENKSLILANAQNPESKGLQATQNMKSEDSDTPLTINDYSNASSRPEDLQKNMEHGDNERAPNSLSLASEPSLKTKELPKSAGFPSLPTVQLDEASKQTSTDQETAVYPRNISKVETYQPIILSRLKDRSPEQTVAKAKMGVKKLETPRPASRVFAAEPEEQVIKDGPHHGKIMEILEAAVCTDVKGRKPFGKADSFRWSTDRVYIWNVIKCESHLSSIRHIYYFNGQKVGDIVLDVRSPTWRTWSYKELSDKRFIGLWRVDIISVDGELLQSVKFEVS